LAFTKSYESFVKSNQCLGKFNGGGVVVVFFLVRLRSSSLLNIYWQWFRPVGDFTFSKPVETFYPQQAKKLTTESLSYPNNSLLL